ncbi:hypothetical protein ACFLZE_04450 [Thermodesulfobacteriota bacterium]
MTPSHAVSASDTSKPWVDSGGLIQSSLIEVKESRNTAPPPGLYLPQFVEVGRDLGDPHQHCQRWTTTGRLLLNEHRNFVQIFVDHLQN